MTPAQASEYLLDEHGIRRAPATLATLRTRGGGPAFRKAGRKDVIYDKAALDAWAGRIKSGPVENTSQLR